MRLENPSFVAIDYVVIMHSTFDRLLTLGSPARQAVGGESAKNSAIARKTDHSNTILARSIKTIGFEINHSSKSNEPASQQAKQASQQAKHASQQARQYDEDDDGYYYHYYHGFCVV